MIARYSIHEYCMPKRFGFEHISITLKAYDEISNKRSLMGYYDFVLRLLKQHFKSPSKALNYQFVIHGNELIIALPHEEVF